MQRVAIARALVNNPDIILADEPTGALDSETSVQIMEILKEISQDKLIIMVTHNPNLAKTYSTRIIRLLDGRTIDDNNPYHTEDVKATSTQVKSKKVKTSKTSMSFTTALTLSLRNLTTKKARTFLTAFAGSIGIIGIALVLALSNGFQTYIDKMQADTLSNYPLTIAESSYDFSSFSNSNMRSNIEEYPVLEYVYVNKIMDKLKNITIKNKLTEDYIDNAVKTIDKSLYYSISYTKDVKLNIYKENKEQNYYQQVTTSSQYGSVWQELLDNENFIKSQYDILAGKLPTNKNEIVVIVDKYNQLTDITLMSLGLMGPNSEIENFTFNDILNLEYKLILNDDFYKYNGNMFTKLPAITSEIYNIANAVPLKVVGILRANSETTSGSITGSIGYSNKLTEFVLNAAQESEVVKWQKNNHETNVLTGLDFVEGPKGTVDEQYLATLASIGGKTTPTGINIYPVDFNAKQLIKDHLDAYNNTVLNEEDKVYYTDFMEILVNSINTVINSISYVLIAFTAVSLVVSSIMIGIITYISVLERTKEIGVLRSIGARKKDISRVFNAETLIIGFAAGLIGVVTTMLLSIPINLILNSLVKVKGIASLNPIHGIILILISMGLTLIAGIIPSRMAAKKDPVVALRTE